MLCGMRGKRKGFVQDETYREHRPGQAVSVSWVFKTLDVQNELPRKEVIQPHLPVRLPCYDFVPIAGSALDTSLSCELGQWLQAYPTFMT